MQSLEFDFHWESGDGLLTPELRETMASVSIRVNGDVITEVYDGRSRSVRNVIHVPLYPLAEWIATHWFPLLFECPSPGRSGFDQRHSFFYGREGFAMPLLRLIPEGEWMQIAWQASSVPFSDLRFLSSGEARLERREVERALADLVNATVARVRAGNLDKPTTLEEEWTSVSALSADERTFCRTVGSLGLDPFSTNAAQDQKIIAAAGQLPEGLASEFFNSANWPAFDENLAWIRQSLELVAGAGKGVALNDFRRSVHETLSKWAHSTPWEIGYQCAREVRKALGCNGQPLLDKSLGEVGWYERISCARSEFFDALVASNEAKETVSVGISTGNSISQRFAFARALFEYFSAEAFPRIVTRSASNSQKESRAFAAELLAPAEALLIRIHGDSVSPEQITDLSEEFAVSSMVVEHQIRNHRIARINTTF